jgi:hypothetical protein
MIVTFSVIKCVCDSKTVFIASDAPEIKNGVRAACARCEQKCTSFHIHTDGSYLFSATLSSGVCGLFRKGGHILNFEAWLACEVCSVNSYPRTGLFISFWD